LAQIAEWQMKYPLQYTQEPDGELMPQFVCEQIYEVTQGDAIITTEVGQHQMWAAQYYHCLRPRQFITSGGLGTMGYGFPAAIGAQLACPNAIVIDIAGDGSFQMNVQELATVVQYNLPVIVAILNNHSLGMVRQWQQFFYDGRYADTSLEVSPDYVKLADAKIAVAANPNNAQAQQELTDTQNILQQINADAELSPELIQKYLGVDVIQNELIPIDPDDPNAQQIKGLTGMNPYSSKVLNHFSPLKNAIDQRIKQSKETERPAVKEYWETPKGKKELQQIKGGETELKSTYKIGDKDYSIEELRKLGYTNEQIITAHKAGTIK